MFEGLKTIAELTIADDLINYYLDRCNGNVMEALQTVDDRLQSQPSCSVMLIARTMLERL